MKNKIGDLRDRLFMQLERLGDPKVKPEEIDRARAVADVARVVVDSAKAEVEFLKATGRTVGTGFIETPELTLSSPPAPAKLAAGSKTR